MRGKSSATSLDRYLVIATVLGICCAGNARAQHDPPPLFTDLVVLGARPVQFGDAGWGDLDLDGDLDLILSGLTRSVGNTADPLQATLQVLFNVGTTFVERPDPDGGDTPIQVPATEYIDGTLVSPAPEGQWLSSISLLDFDGDGDLDVAITGRTDTHGAVLLIMENLGGSRFRQRWRLDGVRAGDMDAADLDGDGDTDLVLAGEDEDGHPVVRAVMNRMREGEGFVEQTHGIPGFANGSVSVADYDLDGDKDLLLVGMKEPQEFASAIYRYDSGEYLETALPIPGLAFPFAAWGDYDADGDPDIVGIGARFSPLLLEGVVYVLENQAGSFVDRTSMLSGTFPGSAVDGRFRGSAGFAEFDGDGRSDLFLAGSIRRTKTDYGHFYGTSGGFGWKEMLRDYLDGGLGGRVYMGDHDNDGDLDVMTVGESTSAGAVIRVRSNSAPRPDINVPRRNRRPLPPNNLTEEISGPVVMLRWTAGSDPDTPPPGLTYEVRVGLMPNNDFVVPAASDGSGHRLMAAMGNAGSNLFLQISGLNRGTYYWSVQSIDPAFAGSVFSELRSFTIE